MQSKIAIGVLTLILSLAASAAPAAITIDDLFDDGILGVNVTGTGHGFRDGSSAGAMAREEGNALTLDVPNQPDNWATALAVSRDTLHFWDGDGATIRFTVKSLAPGAMDRSKRIRGLTLGVVAAEKFSLGADLPGTGEQNNPNINVSLLDDDSDGKVEGYVAVEYDGHYTNQGQEGRVAHFEFDAWDGSTPMTFAMKLDNRSYDLAFTAPVTFTSGSAFANYPDDFPPMGGGLVFAGHQSFGGDAMLDRICVIGGRVSPPAPMKVYLDDSFTSGEAGAMPEGWSVVARNQAIAPRFALVEADGAEGGRALMAQGIGRRECFGYAVRKVTLGGGSCRMRVRFKVDGIDDVNRHLLHAVFGEFNDGLFEYTPQPDGWIVGERCFRSKAGEAEMRLTFRFSPEGKVWWDRVTLEECEPIAPRLVTIACSSGGHDMAFWDKWLDLAGQRKVDIALLPEMLNGKPVEQAEPIGGPTGTFLAQKAKQWKMYVSGSFYEARGDVTYNTAPLYDRQGELVGTYEKVELYDPELDQGCSPGEEMRVFQTDFGKVGTMICYDSWHAETCRLLAYKGAELILFPNAGYYMGLMPARAADNGVWIAVSTLGGDRGIWDSAGIRAGQAQRDPSQGCDSSIVSVQDDPENCMLIATVDLSRQISPHNWGGPMLSAPGGRRARQTANWYLEDEIAREVRRWQTNP